MRVTLYKSSLCPRCHLARKYLERLQQVGHDIDIEYIDILKEPVRAWKDGIRMIPAIKAGGRLISGVYLGESKIKEFLSQSAQDNTTK